MAKRKDNLRAKASVTRDVHVGLSEGERTEEPVEQRSRKVHDPLEGFDVESGSEKDFLEYCLENDTPELEIKLLENACRSPTPDSASPLQHWRTDMTREEWDDTVAAAKCSASDWQEFKFLENATTEEINGRIYELIMDEKNEEGQFQLGSLEYLAPFLVLQKRVEEFASSHRISIKNHVTYTTQKRREFGGDVYNYARALGMSKSQAELEVKRARAAYRSRWGPPSGFKLNETDDESIPGLEINDAIEYVQAMRDKVDQGMIGSAGVSTELTRLQMKFNSTNVSSKKHKRHMKKDDDDKLPSCLNMKGGTDEFHSTTMEVNDTAQPERPLSTKSKPKYSEQQRARKREKSLKRRRRARERQKLESDSMQIARVKKMGVNSQLSLKSTKLKQENGQKVTDSDQSFPSSHVVLQSSPPNLVSPQQPALSKDSSINTPQIVKQEFDDFVDPCGKKMKRIKQRKDPLSSTNSGLTNLTSKIDGFKSIRKDRNNSRIGQCYVEKAPRISAYINSLTSPAQPQQKAHIGLQRIEPPISFLDKTFITGIRSDDKENSQDEEISGKNVTQNLPLLKMEGAEEYIDVPRDLLEAKVAYHDRGRGKKQCNQEQSRATKRQSLVGNRFPSSGNHSLELLSQKLIKQRSPCEDVVSKDFDNKMAVKFEALIMVSQTSKDSCRLIGNSSLPPESTSCKIKMDMSDSEKLNSRDSIYDSEGSAFTTEAGSLYDGQSVNLDAEETDFDLNSKRLSPPKTPSKPDSATNLNSNILQTPKSENQSREIFHDQSRPTPKGGRLNFKGSEKKSPVKSPFFSPPPSAQKPKEKPGKKPRLKAGTTSCIPFPPLTSDTFGLLQEKLAHDPFRLLIGVTFLNRTHGKYAIPVFFELMEKYPTPVHILSSRRREIVAIIRHLGLQIKRTDTYIEYARLWTYDPPVKGRRYRVDHYPDHGDGMDIKKEEVLDDTDTRQAWEIGHITQGRYAIDSWRIFCRDVLREEAEGWNGEGREGEFQPEWMRVRPEDKELRAILRWMWLKEGYEWDPFTGEKEPVSQELQKAALCGRIAWDGEGGMRILQDTDEEDSIVITEGPSASALKTLECLETS